MKYIYKNFTTKFENRTGLLEVICKLNEQVCEREYDLPLGSTGISIEDEYITIDYDSCYYQIKLQDNSGIVIDKFDIEDEHIECIGLHDFYEDLHPMHKN